MNHDERTTTQIPARIRTMVDRYESLPKTAIDAFESLLAMIEEQKRFERTDRELASMSPAMNRFADQMEKNRKAATILAIQFAQAMPQVFEKRAGESSSG